MRRGKKQQTHHPRSGESSDQTRAALHHDSINQRGAVLIQVAVAMLALLALSAFVFDYGVMWVSRGQAQNSADAGALSGAISLAFNSPTDQAAARARAIAMAQANKVWNQAPGVTDRGRDVPGLPARNPRAAGQCVKVNVFRNQARGNALPTFFAKLAGVMNQGTLATATAQVVTGDTTACLRPWAVVDRWNEFGPEGPLPLPIVDLRQGTRPARGTLLRQENDVYIPPSASGPGTGYSLPADRGRQFAIKMGPTGGNEISVGLVQDSRSSSRRHHAIGQQHGPEQHSDLQRYARQLCESGDRVPRVDSQ